jgi:hypothetical protein
MKWHRALFTAVHVMATPLAIGGLLAAAFLGLVVLEAALSAVVR